MKYILVTGGVISGIGKGVISSSIGAILKCYDLRVTAIKIDPYINIDAGTFSPFEHGEVFVLDDGSEVDLDLGNYERFLGVTLKKDNNITTGKIYQKVIKYEREGRYLGQTVQVVPHITDAIIDWVESVSKIAVDSSKLEPEIFGGVVGDIESMPYVEAFRQFQFKVGCENFCSIHVSLLPVPSSTNEQKTKPTQSSFKDIRGLGLCPDLLVGRCVNELTEDVIKKLAYFCNIRYEQVLNMPDVSNIYKVPSLLVNQNICSFLFQKFKLESKFKAILQDEGFISKWNYLSDQCDKPLNVLRIALVGKYIRLSDAYASVIKALNHAAIICSRKVEIEYINSEYLEIEACSSKPILYHQSWQKLCISNALLVPGGFGGRGFIGKLNAIEWARTNHIPFLGICLGMQCAIVEIARNVLGWKDAHSLEFAVDMATCSNASEETTESSSSEKPLTSYPMIKEMPEYNPGDMGGTMRLGSRVTKFTGRDSLARKLYGGVDFIEERHRHRYEVNTDFKGELEDVGIKFVGQDKSGERMEIIELSEHNFFMGVQFHPEYKTRPFQPSPIFLGFILSAIGHDISKMSKEDIQKWREHNYSSSR